MSADNRFNFDEDGSKDLVAEWQDTKSDLILEKIFKQVDGMIKGLVFMRGIYQFMESEEIISLIRFKIWRGLHLYNPDRGKLYSFLTNVIHNRITQAQIDLRKDKKSYISMNSEEGECYVDSLIASRDEDYGIEDLSHKIMQVQTTCTDEMELEAQRWLVRSFVKSEFDIKRHHAANAMTRVYGICKDRSRELHDYTLLEVRRAILYGTRPPNVKLEDICGTRQKVLRRYHSFLSNNDFDRLVFLMKNLSSSIIENVDYIVNGHPDAKPLFG